MAVPAVDGSHLAEPGPAGKLAACRVVGPGDGSIRQSPCKLRHRQELFRQRAEILESHEICLGGQGSLPVRVQGTGYMDGLIFPGHRQIQGKVRVPGRIDGPFHPGIPGAVGKLKRYPAVPDGNESLEIRAGTLAFLQEMGHIPFLFVVLDQVQFRFIQGDPGQDPHRAAPVQELQRVHLEGQSRDLGHQIPACIGQLEIPGGEGQVRAHFHGFHLQLSVNVFPGGVFHQRDGPLQPCRKEQLPQDQVQQDQHSGQNGQPFFTFGTHQGLRYGLS